MLRSRTSMLLVWVAAQLACASSPKMPSPDVAVARDYAPVAMGSSWTYAVSYPGQTGEMTVKIVGEKDGYLLDDREGAFRHTQDGLRDRQRYLIRHPITPGATWKTVVSASAVENNTVMSIGEKCETTGGDFPDCLVIESSIRRDENVTLFVRWTWARGVGLVKLETEAAIVGKGRVPQVKQSLVRYATAQGAGEVKKVPGPNDPKNPDEAPNNWTR